MRFLAPLLLVFFFCAGALAADDFTSAIMDGDWRADLRLRYEHVNQEDLPNDSAATTLRSFLGYTTGAWHDTRLMAEGESARSLSGTTYHNGVNGRSNYPGINDPQHHSLNQLWLDNQSLPQTLLRLGRQKIEWDNERFIGNAGWRQNEQTFDAALVENKSLPATTLQYAYVRAFNRIFGDKAPNSRVRGDTHLMRAQYDGLGEAARLVAYGYWIDLDTLRTGASQTHGAILSGKQALSPDDSFTYRAEFARQTDYADNPHDYHASYWHLVPALETGPWRFALGYERLGSGQGKLGFATPFASAHAFSGWADKFVTVPVNGLRDYYGDVTYSLKAPGDSLFTKTTVNVGYHVFYAARGGADYGHEWNALIKQDFKHGFYAEAKFADYQAQDLLTDTQKMMLSLGWVY